VDTPEATVTALLEALGDKRPKVPPACFKCINEAFRRFGGRHMPLKPIRGKLKAMFESTNKCKPSANLLIPKSLAPEKHHNLSGVQPHLKRGTPSFLQRR
jgi:hypothetical protein